MADVALDVKEVLRATAPFSAVQRHDLHEATRADGAPGVRIERRVFGEQNSNQQRRVDLLLVGLVHERVGYTECQGAVMGVLVQDLTNTESLLGRL